MKRFKKWILITALIPLFAFANENGYEYYEYDYYCIPYKDHFTLAKDPKIDVFFLYKEDYKKAVAKFFPNDNPRSLGGFIIEYLQNGKKMYEVYIPREHDWKTGEIFENHLGHEIMHILDWNWHKGQVPSKDRLERSIPKQ